AVRGRGASGAGARARRCGADGARAPGTASAAL
ncbi:MAG: hypothetical protein AVDCRST_MAG59-3581, partial [uncultured Thermomicrobiales bacterium]